MTISSSIDKVQIASGNTLNITDLEAQSSSQVLVTKTDADGVESVLILNTDYTINNTVTQVTLDESLGTNELATATLNVAITQSTDFTVNGSLNPETIEDALDKLTLMYKQQAESINRAVLAPISSNVSMEIPSPANNANRYLKANGDGTGLEFVNASEGGIDSVEEDTSPALGGDLDMNGNDIMYDIDMPLGKWVKIASQTLSAATNIQSPVLLSSYKKIVAIGKVSLSDATSFIAAVSSDNGGSYPSTSYGYSLYSGYVGSGGEDRKEGTATGTGIELSQGTNFTFDSSQPVRLEVSALSPVDNDMTIINVDFKYQANVGSVAGWGRGIFHTAASHQTNRFKLTPNSGTVTGTVDWYALI